MFVLREGPQVRLIDKKKGKLVKKANDEEEIDKMSQAKPKNPPVPRFAHPTNTESKKKLDEDLI